MRKMYTIQDVRNPPAANAMPHSTIAFQMPQGNWSERFVTAPSPSAYRDVRAYPPNPHNTISNSQPNTPDRCFGVWRPDRSQQTHTAALIITSTPTMRN